MNRNWSYSPRIYIHDKDEVILESKKIKVGLKDLQMWFQKIKFNAYWQFIIDHLFGIDTAFIDYLFSIDTAFINHFTFRDVAKYEYYTNKKGEISFLVLIQEIALDSF